ncbi:hypothetical protein V500_09125 [Pseudogymnoascus sp. VKM F-4518 (FW-2643)]|nr:hypothetical protein V500_09125 [Pseudogymnoascus sp. VKM F-4518 (FW-2643)]
MEKADELRSEFGCDIYILGRRNGKLFNYTSRDGPFWPLSLTEVDQSYPRAERYAPASFLKRGTKSLLEGRKGRGNPVRAKDERNGTLSQVGGRKTLLGWLVTAARGGGLSSAAQPYVIVKTRTAPNTQWSVCAPPQVIVGTYSRQHVLGVYANPLLTDFIPLLFPSWKPRLKSSTQKRQFDNLEGLTSPCKRKRKSARSATSANKDTTVKTSATVNESSADVDTEFGAPTAVDGHRTDVAAEDTGVDTVTAVDGHGTDTAPEDPSAGTPSGHVNSLQSSIESTSHRPWTPGSITGTLNPESLFTPENTQIGAQPNPKLDYSQVTGTLNQMQVSKPDDDANVHLRWEAVIEQNETGPCESWRVLVIASKAIKPFEPLVRAAPRNEQYLLHQALEFAKRGFMKRTSVTKLKA